jgi:cytoskeletal protein RodZ
MDIIPNQDVHVKPSVNLSKPPKSKKTRKPIFIVILVVLVLASVAAAGYYYSQYQDIKKNPQQVTIDETKAIVAKVSKSLTLPEKEQPTLATVLDKEKLKDQAFFKDAQNGDKILIYTEAKKAIIYRESEDKIINVGPILLNSDTKELKKDN